MEVEREHEKEYYQTPSLYVCSALILSGFQPELFNQADNRIIFRFLFSESLEKALSDYHSGKLVLPVDRFSTTLLNLKSMIYSHKNRKGMNRE